jgi:hypothetical protein
MAITTDLVEAFLKYSTKCGSDSFCSEAETEARARSHFRRVLHDESGQNWRGQLAERSDASLTEVLSKLTQVTTLVSNCTFGESTFAVQVLSKPRNR